MGVLAITRVASQEHLGNVLVEVLLRASEVRWNIDGWSDGWVVPNIHSALGLCDPFFKEFGGVLTNFW